MTHTRYTYLTNEELLRVRAVDAEVIEELKQRLSTALDKVEAILDDARVEG